MMRRKTGIAAGFAIMILTASLALSACGGGLSKEAQEYRAQGIEAYENSDFETAAEEFEKALEEVGDRVSEKEMDIRYYLAASLYGIADYDGALAQYDTLAAEDEENYRPYFLRGCVYAKTGRIDEADGEFKEAIVRNGADFDLYISIYQTLADAGEQKRGTVYLKRAKKIEAEKPEEYCKLGHIYYLLEDYDNARTNLSEAVDNDVLDAMLYLGMTEAKAGNTDEAKKSFEEFANRKKDDAAAIGRLAASMLSCGMAEESIPYFEEAISMTEGEEQKDYKKGLIGAYEQITDFDKAKELAEEYVAAWPEDQEAAKELEFLSTR